MSPLKVILVIAIITMGSMLGTDAAIASETESPRNAAQIIESYVQDFRSDRFAAEPMLFAIAVPGQGEWHVRVTGEQSDAGWKVKLGDGPPPMPTFINQIDAETLGAIDRGEINALTAQGKAFIGDYTPMSIEMMDGFDPSAEQYDAINPFSFHFWTRGFPEIIPFGEAMTRRAHGGNFVIFYYEKGLRTAWYRINPEDRVREDAREQAMPFPIMVVGIKGTAEGEVDGQRVSLPAGNTVFIPPNVTHRWWNETDEPADAILIMFGDGA
jgi:mannose-6-phosphate isomerase-like protein (cupin superfamily)